MINPSKDGLSQKQVAVGSMFWVALFLPINLLFQPTLFAVELLRPDLDSPLKVVTLVKLTYFLSVCSGVYALAKIWPKLPDARSNAVAMGYRLAGLATVGGLIAVHTSGIYHYGALERQLYRETRTANRAMPIRVAEGIELERIQLEKRDVIYEFTLANVSADQFDSKKFRDGAFLPAKKIVCSSKELMRTMSHDVRLRYVYRDKNGQPLADFAFEHATCAGTPG